MKGRKKSRKAAPVTTPEVIVLEKGVVLTIVARLDGNHPNMVQTTMLDAVQQLRGCEGFEIQSVSTEVVVLPPDA